MRDYAALGIEITTQRTSGNIKTTCPNCRDHRGNPKDKSLSVDLSTGMYHCHHCDWKGIVKDDSQLWMEKQSWYNEKPKKKDYIKPTKKEGALGEGELKYFFGRGISHATLQDLKITCGKEWMPQVGCERSTIQFNYYHNGELKNVKYRTPDKLFKLVSGAELLPYNIDAIKGQPTCIITEGEFDALSFHEVGLHSVVSVPNGANANLSYLDDYIAEYFEDKETIYIASDTDEKGMMLRQELIRRFGAERCRVITYGDDCKDANDLLKAHGADALRKAYNDAKDVLIDGVVTLKDIESDLDVIWREGLKQGVTIGHPNFDKLCSFETKRVCIVTGIPSSGKSEFIDEMAERLNMRYGWRFGYFSPENSPLTYHASKLIEKITGVPFKKETLNQEDYIQAKQYLDENFFFINPSTDYKVDTILACAKWLVRRKGIKAVVIDPYNRLESEHGWNISETNYISSMLDKLSNFAKMNDVMVILMAHPNKQQRNKEGIFEAPTLYDISGSAHFYNKCDFGLVVHRNRAEDYTEVHVCKVKFRHLGSTGVAFFKYNIQNGRYTPLGDGNIPYAEDNTNHLQKTREKTNLTHSLTFDNANSNPDALDFAKSTDETPF